VARIPYPRPDGIQDVIDTLAESNPRAASFAKQAIRRAN
jgi:hypothetical protein